MSELKITRRGFLGWTVAGTAAGLSGLSGCGTVRNADREAAGAGATRRSARPPNIVFILADDLGWGDLSIYGRTDYATPNIDKLATQGVRLTQAYSNSSVCTPTRIAYLTGRYQQRLPIGLQEPLGNRKQLRERGQLDRLGLPPDHPTIASLLKAGGYETALVGKWHSGYLPTFSPLKSGFDHFFGIFSGAVDYFTHKDGSGEADLWEDETPVERTGYITDLITRRAIEFLGKASRSKDPFYLSLHYTAPHWPWEGPGDDAVSRRLKSLFHYDGGSIETYGEMVRSLDTGVGEVLATLDSLGLADDTLVVFTSDNGGERFSQIWPFVGSKGGVYEGSNRVPAIVRFPGRLPADRISHQVAATFDWTASLLAVAGVSPHHDYPLDGIDLLPYLAQAGSAAKPLERALFWRIHGQHAARIGDLKYIKLARPEQAQIPGGLAARGTEFLFDLSRDVREQANLKDQRPGDLQRLSAAWEAWNAEVLPEPAAAKP
ncbi:sulfatase [Methylococcus sp. EFPC2]|uniref:sulfatase family protein n=1 Tax=Methylococcus sp. EFPC2 TaxID=2812648 RepID=UPI0019687D04|nr:sulfatase-like hydrolase/transferase [Methylococcus sp. EFPC2]QSA97943.1 sulfatase-like hydrolase/transferase [Methylococcus sp. EFPC2]